MRPETADRLCRAREMRSLGERQAAIAAELGISRQAVHQLLARPDEAKSPLNDSDLTETAAPNEAGEELLCTRCIAAMRRKRDEQVMVIQLLEIRLEGARAGLDYADKILAELEKIQSQIAALEGQKAVTE